MIWSVLGSTKVLSDSLLHSIEALAIHVHDTSFGCYRLTGFHSFFVLDLVQFFLSSSEASKLRRVPILPQRTFADTVIDDQEPRAPTTCFADQDMLCTGYALLETSTTSKSLFHNTLLEGSSSLYIDLVNLIPTSRLSFSEEHTRAQF